jgi:hypothetical protein
MGGRKKGKNYFKVLVHSFDFSPFKIEKNIILLVKYENILLRAPHSVLSFVSSFIYIYIIYEKI